MANGTAVARVILADETKKNIANLPTERWARREAIIDLKRDAALALAMARFEDAKSKVDDTAEREHSRWRAQQARAERDFGFGMNTPRQNQTPQ
jgi:hypothetical protein